MDEPGEVALGAPVTETLVLNAAFTTLSNGTPAMVAVASGTPAVVSLVDARTGKQIGTRPLPGAEESVSVWAITTDPHSNVVAFGTTSGRAFTFVPDSLNLTELPSPPGSGRLFLERAAWSDSGSILFTSYPDARLLEYLPTSRTWRDHGSFGDGNKYSMGLALRGHDAYVGTGTRAPSVWHVDLVSGTKRNVGLPSPVDANVQRDFVFDLCASGHYLYARVQAENRVYVRDLERSQWIDGVSDIAPGLVASGEDDGTVYMTRADQRVVRYDPARKAATELNPAFAVSSFRGAGWQQLGVEADGESLVTTNASGKLLMWNEKSGASEVQHTDVAAGAFSIRALGIDGRGEVYVGGLATIPSAAVYSPTSNSFTTVPMRGQVEAFAWAHGSMLAGTYPGGNIQRFGTDASGAVILEPATSIGHSQDRPVAMAEAPGGLVAVVSIPDYGAKGGAISFVDLNRATTRVYRGIAGDHSMLSVAVDAAAGIAYAGSGASGGYGTRKSVRDGRIVALDVASGEVVSSLVPVPGEPNVSALVLDADGQLWGLTLETIFRVDTQAMKVVTRKSYSSRNDSSIYYRGRSLWDDGDQLIGCAGGSIFAVDKATLKKNDFAEGSNLVRRSNGDLYYSRGADLYRWTGHV